MTPAELETVRHEYAALTTILATFNNEWRSVSLEDWIRWRTADGYLPAKPSAEETLGRLRHEQHIWTEVVARLTHAS